MIIFSGNYTTDGIVIIYHGQPKDLFLFGSGFEDTTLITFTKTNLTKGELCDDYKDTDAFRVELDRPSTTFASSLVLLALSAEQTNQLYYICVKTGNNITSHYIHQGFATYLTIMLQTIPESENKPLLPLPLQVGCHDVS